MYFTHLIVHKLRLPIPVKLHYIPIGMKLEANG